MINTLNPEFFKEHLTAALKNRREKDSNDNSRYIEMEEGMLNLIKSSQHVSRGKFGGTLLITYSQPWQGTQPSEYQYETTET